jgi:hypothetical protein
VRHSRTLWLFPRYQCNKSQPYGYSQHHTLVLVAADHEAICNQSIPNGMTDYTSSSEQKSPDHNKVVKGKYSRLKQSGIFNLRGMLPTIQFWNLLFNSRPPLNPRPKVVYIGLLDVQTCLGKNK